MGKAASSSQLRLLADERAREKVEGMEEENPDGDQDEDGDRHVVVSLSANGQASDEEETGSPCPARPRPRHRTYFGVWLAVCMLGAINNWSYVVVLSAAKSLAQSFHQENLIGVIQWANVGFGTVVKALNTWWLLQTPYNTRVIANTVMGTAGLIMLALSGYVNFPFAIVGIVLIGCFSSLGESVILGYLRDYDASLVGAWSSGTGAAGVGGTLFYLLMYSVVGVGNRVIFLSLLPLSAVYVFSFHFAARHVHHHPAAASPSSSSPSPPPHPHSHSHSHSHRRSSSNTYLMHVDVEPVSVSASASATPSNSSSTSVESSWAHTRRVARVIASMATQLTAVYFFEYVASVGFAAKANPSGSSSDASWFSHHAYEILAFCYQFGVLISRSSLPIIKIRRIWILTLLQGCNFLLWFAHVQWLFLPLAVQFVHMVFIGLLGGAMYANVFYLISTEPHIQYKDRELAINLTTMAVNVGIVASSVAEIIIDNTIFRHKL